MKINEVIRKYRKQQNLTQEQVANFLGVTAPAVNKWENAISYPDITLLAPLARILEIDVDTLLSFHEEISDQEIDQLVGKVSELMQTNEYHVGYEEAFGYIKKYPNCNKLILVMTSLLNAYLSIKHVENCEKYEKQILGWYEVVAECDDIQLAANAAASLCQLYMAKMEYHKAQQLLDKIPPVGYDKRIMQANLFSKEKKVDEAYEVLEKMLYQASNEICSILQLLVNYQCKEQKFEESEKYAEIGQKVAALFGLGSYIEYTSFLFIAIEKQDKEKSIEMLDKIVDGIDTINGSTNYYLYSHAKFGTFGNTDDLINKTKNLIRKALETDKTLDFIREEAEFKRILEKLR